MKVERIAKDKVRIFVSYDDLEDRGIDRNEIWQNGRKVQELFWDMMETAYTEVGFEIAGPIAVEAFTMPSEGVVVIVTRVPSLPGHSREDDDDLDVESSTDMFSSLVFSFKDFEDVIRAAHILKDYDLNTSLYQFHDAYHLYVEEEGLSEDIYDSVWSILHEYGEYASVTVAMLEEYGKLILRDSAVTELAHRFQP